MSALDVQVGGDHYKRHKIQPVQYIHANGLGYCEGAIVKYITRWRFKGGLADLQKIKHYVDLLIELEGMAESSSSVQAVTGLVLLNEEEVALHHKGWSPSDILARRKTDSEVRTESGRAD